MKNRKPIWDILSEEERKECTDEIIGFFQDVRGEKIGILGAGQILDLIMEKLVWKAYNKGIEDVTDRLQEKFADINVDLDLLKRK